jgi:hypothetical protein
MSVLIIDFMVIAAVICAPAILFFPFRKLRSQDYTFTKLAKNLKLKIVCNRENMSLRQNFIQLPVDRVVVDANIIDLCTEIYAAPKKQKIYSMYTNQHHKFYSSYMEGRWEMAIVIATSLRTAWDGQLSAYYELMISRCKNFKQHTPTNEWNGIVIKG